MTIRRTLSFTTRSLGWAALLIAPAMLGARGCEVAVVGSECGGLQGAQCEADQFCNFAPDAACGAADQTGTCEVTPEFCTEQFDPVCGCDDVTYGNACAANSAGVSVAREGECEPTGGGGLNEGEACGGLLGLSCDEGLFCDFAPGAFCGAADQTGTCKPTPEVCEDIFSPVCGCDGETHANACTANGLGVSVASQGECLPTGGGGGGECGGLLGLACDDDEFCKFAPDAFCGAADQTGTCEPLPQACDAIFDPVCGCDDQTYSSDCAANLAGVSVASDGECAPTGGGGADCGGLLGLGCADGEFCNFAPDAFCGAADQTGTCEAIPSGCTRELNPVCGCDGVTYSNPCGARSAGVSVASQGECPPSGTACGGLLGGQCAEGEFCNYSLEAICGAADQTGICEPIPEVCTDQFEPVCGCNDQTFGNSCEANAAGISVASLGECP